MSIESENSIESFEECGFDYYQAEHLSRLSISMYSLIAKKKEPCTKDMFEFYQERIESLRNEIDYYWEKYKKDNFEGLE